jgi:hypothetical protein
MSNKSRIEVVRRRGWGAALPLLTLLACEEGVQEEAEDVFTTTQAVASAMGSFEFAIDAPWRLEPSLTAPPSYGPLPIMVSHIVRPQGSAVGPGAGARPRAVLAGRVRVSARSRMPLATLPPQASQGVAGLASVLRLLDRPNTNTEEPRCVI